MIHTGALLKLTVQPGRTPTVVLVGEIDAGNAAGLRSVLRCLLATGARSLRIDCTDLVYMDAAMLRVLAETAPYTGARGDTIVLRGLSDLAHRLLEVSGLSEQTTIDVGGSPGPSRQRPDTTSSLRRAS